MAHCYMTSTSLLLRLFCSLLFLVPIFSSRAIPDVDDSTAYIRLPSSSVQVTNIGGDGGDHIYEYSSSDVLPEDLVKGAPNRDFLVLALQWPKAVSTILEVRRLTPLSFTIHGLWGSIPNEKCPAVTNDPNLLTPLTTELGKYWVNARATSKVAYEQLSYRLKFWGYEWTKHGGCTDLAQVAYFEKALELIKANDVTKIVMDNFRGDINQGLRVNTADLRDKVDTGLGGITSMVCSANCFLQEFRLYIRTSDWKVIDYPRPLSCNCPNGVLFLN